MDYLLRTEQGQETRGADRAGSRAATYSTKSDGDLITLASHPPWTCYLLIGPFPGSAYRSLEPLRRSSVIGLWLFPGEIVLSQPSPSLVSLLAPSVSLQAAGYLPPPNAPGT